MKKHGFTIIELVIVMAILSIMFITTRNYFSSENKIYYEGEVCINNMYYGIKEISNAALLGRTRSLSGVFFSSGNNIQSPDWYSIIFRIPSYFAEPQFPVNVEAASGLVKIVRSNPTILGTIGIFNGENFIQEYLQGREFLYRGTGNVTDPIDYNADNFAIQYLPMRGLNYPTTGGNMPIKGCNSPSFFVTYTLSVPTPNATTLRVGFQNSSDINTKKMIIQPGQWMSGAMADLNTGAINLQVCNERVECKETHRLFFDTRVNDVFLQRCATYGTNKKCAVRQGGDIN